MVVDADVRVLPADAALALAAIAVDPIAGTCDPPEPLRVEVQHVAGRGVLVAQDLQRLACRRDETLAVQHRADRRAGDSEPL